MEIKDLHPILPGAMTMTFQSYDKEVDHHG